MISIQTNGPSSLRHVFRPLLNLLGRLAHELRAGGSGNEEMDELRGLLETLPLTTEEFSLATNRLANAHRYVKAREAGAARWELNALRQQLAEHAETRTRVTRS